MRRSSGAGIVLVATAIVAVAAIAAADVVTPVACPPGLVVRGAHERDCWPRTCSRASDCGEGAQCRRVSRCIETRQIHEGDSMETTPRDFDHGACGAGSACAAGTCRELSRCEPTEPTASFVEGRWTGEPYQPPPASTCAVARGRGGSGSALVLVALALARRARRTRASA